MLNDKKSESMFSSRELYLSNGGQFYYMHRDGLAGEYAATKEEEKAWAKEVQETSLKIVGSGTDETALQSAISNLNFHHYPALENVLYQRLLASIGTQRLFFALSLWKITQDDALYPELFKTMVAFNPVKIRELLPRIELTPKREIAQQFMLYCLGYGADEWINTAQLILSIWASRGCQQLLQNNILSRLYAENKTGADFRASLNHLKIIFNNEK